MALVDATAKRALELDSTLSMPWAALSMAEMRKRPVDWETAIDLADRAMEANPNNTTALLWRSVSWVYLGYLRQGDCRPAALPGARPRLSELPAMAIPVPGFRG